MEVLARAAFILGSCTALLLCAEPAMAQKKPGGGTETCVGFPAFIYWQQSAKSQQIFVADQNGKCARPVVLVTGTGGASAARFSMVTPTLGRVVFPDAGGVVSAVDFTVNGTSIQVQPRRPVAVWGCCTLDLSSDGLSLYVPTEKDSAGITTLYKISVDGSAQPVPIRTLDGIWNFVGISVDRTGAIVYTDEEELSGPGKRLMRIDVGSTEGPVELVEGNGGRASYYPAADLAVGADRFAYAYYLAGLDRCFDIRVASSNGQAAAPLAPTRYGTRLTWLLGSLLATERKPPDSTGRCAATGNVARISADGTSSTVLVRGYDPDAR